MGINFSHLFSFMFLVTVQNPAFETKKWENPELVWLPLGEEIKLLCGIFLMWFLIR